MCNHPVQGHLRYTRTFSGIDFNARRRMSNYGSILALGRLHLLNPFFPGTARPPIRRLPWPLVPASPCQM